MRQMKKGEYLEGNTTVVKYVGIPKALLLDILCVRSFIHLFIHSEHVYLVSTTANQYVLSKRQNFKHNINLCNSYLNSIYINKHQPKYTYALNSYYVNNI